MSFEDRLEKLNEKKHSVHTKVIDSNRSFQTSKCILKYKSTSYINNKIGSGL